MRFFTPLCVLGLLLGGPAEAQQRGRLPYLPGFRPGFTYLAPAYDADASALFARMTTPPSTADKNCINAFIVAEKVHGYWTILDWQQVYAVQDAQVATLNWKSSSFNGTNQGATFTAYQGWASDGVATYFDTGWAPSNGVNYTQNAASVAVWNRTAAADLTATTALLGSGTADRVRLSPRVQGDAFQYRLNASAGTNTASAVGVGLFGVTRTAVGLTQGYINGAATGAAGGATSGALSAATLNVGRYNTTLFNTKQAALAASGGVFSAQNWIDFYADALAYMQCVGAA